MAFAQNNLWKRTLRLAYFSISTIIKYVIHFVNRMKYMRTHPHIQLGHIPTYRFLAFLGFPAIRKYQALGWLRLSRIWAEGGGKNLRRGKETEDSISYLGTSKRSDFLYPSSSSPILLPGLVPGLILYFSVSGPGLGGSMSMSVTPFLRQHVLTCKWIMWQPKYNPSTYQVHTLRVVGHVTTQVRYKYIQSV